MIVSCLILVVVERCLTLVVDVCLEHSAELVQVEHFDLKVVAVVVVAAAAAATVVLDSSMGWEMSWKVHLQQEEDEMVELKVSLMLRSP